MCFYRCRLSDSKRWSNQFKHLYAKYSAYIVNNVDRSWKKINYVFIPTESTFKYSLPFKTLKTSQGISQHTFSVNWYSVLFQVIIRSAILQPLNPRLTATPGSAANVSLLLQPRLEIESVAAVYGNNASILIVWLHIEIENDLTKIVYFC